MQLRVTAKRGWNEGFHGQRSLSCKCRRRSSYWPFTDGPATSALSPLCRRCWLCLVYKGKQAPRTSISPCDSASLVLSCPNSSAEPCPALLQTCLGRFVAQLSVSSLLSPCVLVSSALRQACFLTCQNHTAGFHLPTLVPLLARTFLVHCSLGAGYIPADFLCSA